jgi:hypothetical protein
MNQETAYKRKRRAGTGFTGRTVKEIRTKLRNPSPNPNKKFLVHASQGQGDCVPPDLEFDTLKEVLDWVDEHKDEASFGIEYPDGTWHNWNL